jgi:hypothetical protein
VKHAYELLCKANQRAIQVPAEVVGTIIQARSAIKEGLLVAKLETQFWNAYGLLSSSIEPAESARQAYRRIFYGVLSLLLVVQFFYLSGALVRDKVADIGKQIIEIRGKAVSVGEDIRGKAVKAATPGGDGQPPVTPLAMSESEQLVTQLTQRRTAYLLLAEWFLGPLATVADSQLQSLASQNSPHAITQQNELKETMIMGILEMLLAFFSEYLLPMLYGLTGSCAFVLRKLSDEIDKLTYAHDAKVRHTLRLNIGLLAGLAVGWFLKPSASDPSLTSLSPLALAFIAGYGSDMFFVFLDKAVNTFTPAGNAAATPRFEATMGSVTPTQTQEVAGRVADRVLPEDTTAVQTAQAAVHAASTPPLSSNGREPCDKA